MNQSTQEKKQKQKKNTHSCTQILFFFSIKMIWNVLAEKYTAVTMETEIQAMF